MINWLYSQAYHPTNVIEVICGFVVLRRTIINIGFLRLAFCTSSAQQLSFSRGLVRIHIIPVALRPAYKSILAVIHGIRENVIRWLQYQLVFDLPYLHHFTMMGYFCEVVVAFWYLPWPTSVSVTARPRWCPWRTPWLALASSEMFLGRSRYIWTLLWVPLRCL